MQIHIARNGQRLGPYSVEDANTYLKSGALSPFDLAWYEGLSSWVPLRNVPGVIGPPQLPPPLPPRTLAVAMPHTLAVVPFQNKSRTAYILLGIFLGTLGIHNFFAGYTGRGIAQLLTSVLIGWLIIPLLAVWIWVLVEICTVTTDANGMPFC